MYAEKLFSALSFAFSLISNLSSVSFKSSAAFLFKTDFLGNFLGILQELMPKLNFQEVYQGPGKTFQIPRSFPRHQCLDSSGEYGYDFTANRLAWKACMTLALKVYFPNKHAYNL